MNASSPSPAANPAPAQPAQLQRTEILLNPLEQKGALYADRLHSHIASRGGQYLRDEDGNLFVFLDGRNIALNSEDLDLASLLLRVCNVTTVISEARIAIRRLEIRANENCSNVRERHFSALSEDESRIFIPVRDEKLLEISENGSGWCQMSPTTRTSGSDIPRRPHSHMPNAIHRKV